MAGLPPETIHVKRKRGTDDNPVDFLRLERSKRYRLSGESGWVYQRKVPENEITRHVVEPATSVVPTIQPTKKGDEHRLRGVTNKGRDVPAAARGSTPSSTPKSTGSSETVTTAQSEGQTTDQSPSDRIRRFHLSKASSLQLTSGVSKKRSAPAVFVERDAKKQRESLKSLVEERNITVTEHSLKGLEWTAAPASQAPPAKLKRPGLRARTKPTTSASVAESSKTGTQTETSKSESQTKTSKLPPSLRNRESDADMNQLARIMDSWTLEEITKNLDRMEEDKTTSKFSAPSPYKSRFRPKAPKLRWFERHPEAAAQQQQKGVKGAENMNIDVAVADGDVADSDDDYIIETYERVPIERLHEKNVPEDKVGLLVFDSEPDMVEFFYGNEEDSDDQFPEDEEDENAENYYTHEYPDEDLDWDDELDRDPYQYTNQNASDREEYDERDFIDEVWDRCDREDDDDNKGGTEELPPWRPRW